MEWVSSIVQAVIGGLITGGAAWTAIRVELKWLRRDVDEARRDVRRAHERIDSLGAGR